MAARHRSRAEILALPADRQFPALLDSLTADERDLLERTADQINALPHEQRIKLTAELVDFFRKRTSN